MIVKLPSSIFSLFTIFLSALVFTLALSAFVPTNAYAEGLFSGKSKLDPKLEKRREKERQQRQELEQQKARQTLKREFEEKNTDFDTDLVLTDDKERGEYDESKEYMSYFQRLLYTWRNADSFQDLFDLSLASAYAPATVTSNYINIKSGPGEGYPIVYVAEKDEVVDFTAIRTEWYQLRTPNKRQGWLHKSELAGNLKLEDSSFGFSDEAKKVSTGGKPTDLGFSGGLISDNPTFSLFIKKQNSAFISTEAEIGFARDLDQRLDYFSFNILAHPFTELKYRPHLLLGVGQMKTEAPIEGGTEILSQRALLGKAGIGFSRNISDRVRFRGDLTQYSINLPNSKFNHHSAITLGASYVLGTSSDPIFNRAIGSRVSVTDTELTLLTGSVNLNNIDHFQIVGVRGSYHASDEHFFELNLSQSSSGSDYSQVGVAFAKNLLPSEYIFRWRGKPSAWPTQVYALIGTGLQFVEQDEQVAVTYGLGLRINPLRRAAIRFDLRQHLVHQQQFNGNVFSNFQKNVEMSVGLSAYF